MFHYSREDAAPRRAKINDLPADNPASLFKLGIKYHMVDRLIVTCNGKETGYQWVSTPIKQSS